MPVLCLLSLNSRNSPKQLGMVSPELQEKAVRYGVPGTQDGDQRLSDLGLARGRPACGDADVAMCAAGGLIGIRQQYQQWNTKPAQGPLSRLHTRWSTRLNRIPRPARGAHAITTPLPWLDTGELSAAVGFWYHRGQWSAAGSAELARQVR